MKHGVCQLFMTIKPKKLMARNTYVDRSTFPNGALRQEWRGREGVPGHADVVRRLLLTAPRKSPALSATYPRLLWLFSCGRCYRGCRSLAEGPGLVGIQHRFHQVAGGIAKNTHAPEAPEPCRTATPRVMRSPPAQGSPPGEHSGTSTLPSSAAWIDAACGLPSG